jgi:hypothetical protein
VVLYNLLDLLSLKQVSRTPFLYFPQVLFLFIQVLFASIQVLIVTIQVLFVSVQILILIIQDFNVFHQFLIVSLNL